MRGYRDRRTFCRPARRGWKWPPTIPSLMKIFTPQAHTRGALVELPCFSFYGLYSVSVIEANTKVSLRNTYFSGPSFTLPLQPHRGVGYCITYLTVNGPKPQPRSTPPHLPPPTEHRECAVIIKASGARLVAMHAVKMTVPTQGSVRTTTPSVACTLPVNREGRGARAWGPWRSRGDVSWGDRAPARVYKQNQHTKRQLHNAAKQGVASCGPVVSRGADSVVESGIRPR
jgi:hypothetical protein